MEWVAEVMVGSSSAKHVLAALANFHHDKNGLCNPSKPTLASFTELNWKTIDKWLDHLAKAGFITIEHRPGKSINYVLHFEVTASKIGGGIKAGNQGNLNRGTPSKIGDTPPPNLEIPAPPPKLETYPLQNWSEPPPNLETEQENGNITGLTPYSPPLPKAENHTESANRVIEYLNQRAGKRYRLTANNRKPITARLNEKFTEDDCRLVVDNCCRRWLGTSQAQYLRPETLFRPSKFEGYLNDGGEQGMPQTDQPGYNPSDTDRVIREAFGDDEPNELPPPQEYLPWTH